MADEIKCSLTNDDFRRLLSTPRTEPPTVAPLVQPPPPKKLKLLVEKKVKKKKTPEYLRQEDLLSKLQAKYRDRAQERREGRNPDYVHVCNETELAVELNCSGYHAVSHDPKYSRGSSLRRKQIIQESKYLGGDMAHTHLVKGLDFALLNKVRNEIETKVSDGMKEKEDQRLDELPENQNRGDLLQTKMVRSIISTVFPKMRHNMKNPLFAPGKMLHVINLYDDDGDTDIPTTLVRSNAEVDPESHMRSMITTDAVIEKLGVVLKHVREGKMKKMKKLSSENSHEEKKESKGKTKRSDCSTTFKVETEKKNAEQRAERLLRRLTAEPTSYAECYPGLVESVEAAYDSDEAADYSKIDSTRKGIVGRWDFDHEEDYSEYMTRREALPKAAFQYGLKKSGGRKTRKDKSDKAQLNRLWGEIKSKIGNGSIL